MFLFANSVGGHLLLLFRSRTVLCIRYYPKGLKSKVMEPIVEKSQPHVQIWQPPILWFSLLFQRANASEVRAPLRSKAFPYSQRKTIDFYALASLPPTPFLHPRIYLRRKPPSLFAYGHPKRNSSISNLLFRGCGEDREIERGVNETKEGQQPCLAVAFPSFSCVVGKKS